MDIENCDRTVSGLNQEYDNQSIDSEMNSWGSRDDRNDDRIGDGGNWNDNRHGDAYRDKRETEKKVRRLRDAGRSSNSGGTGSSSRISGGSSCNSNGIRILFCVFLYIAGMFYRRESVNGRKMNDEWYW